MEQDPDLSVLLFILILEHEGHRGLDHLAAGADVLGADAHNPLWARGIGYSDVGVVVGSQLLNIAALLANNSAAHLAGDEDPSLKVT